MDTITVGGPPGSGTSTVCRMLKEELGIEYVYAGQIFRDRAKELGLTLSEFGELCEKDRSYDNELDERMLLKAREGNVLLEGRMIGPLCKLRNIPSFRIYLDADSSVRARRVMERDGGDLGTVIIEMEEREESEAQRYIEYYGVDPRDSSWYDLILDSTSMTPEEELRSIIENIGER
ncbi:MAG: (d)CMP kinase [Thermoplasmatota archaeon]